MSDSESEYTYTSNSGSDVYTSNSESDEDGEESDWDDDSDISSDDEWMQVKQNDDDDDDDDDSDLSEEWQGNDPYYEEEEEYWEEEEEEWEVDEDGVPLWAQRANLMSSKMKEAMTLANSSQVDLNSVAKETKPGEALFMFTPRNIRMKQLNPDEEYDEDGNPIPEWIKRVKKKKEELYSDVDGIEKFINRKPPELPPEAEWCEKAHKTRDLSFLEIEKKEEANQEVPDWIKNSNAEKILNKVLKTDTETAIPQWMKRTNSSENVMKTKIQRKEKEQLLKKLYTLREAIEKEIEITKKQEIKYANRIKQLDNARNNVQISRRNVNKLDTQVRGKEKIKRQNNNKPLTTEDLEGVKAFIEEVDTQLSESRKVIYRIRYIVNNAGRGGRGRGRGGRGRGRGRGGRGRGRGGRGGGRGTGRKSKSKSKKSKKKSSKSKSKKKSSSTNKKKKRTKKPTNGSSSSSSSSTKKRRKKKRKKKSSSTSENKDKDISKDKTTSNNNNNNNNDNNNKEKDNLKNSQSKEKSKTITNGNSTSKKAKDNLKKSTDKAGSKKKDTIKSPSKTKKNNGKSKK
eukprot:TRINITY_DN963_c0_g1_i1.p1 TRINITY_DN963_c0_g1~~TRINITY_DN963_c0_g1_i1.p1  ORF type:complete len:569 (-),score=254.42 TRINITY_DN963_c0_g1_i1:133-1839(-)